MSGGSSGGERDEGEREEFEYAGKEVSIATEQEEPQLRIEGKLIEVARTEEGFYTPYLPYADYPSLRAIAERIAEDWTVLEPEEGAGEDEGEER